jgi:hypothetical protein
VSGAPEWLPPIVSVSGRWSKVVKTLYAIFDQDFRKDGCIFDGRPVWWDRRKVDSPYDEGFWHLITKFDRVEDDRLLDPRRAERLPWCKPTVEHNGDPAVLVWDYEEGNSTRRTYVWLKDRDYVVLLDKKCVGKRNVAFLITAYYVGGSSTRANLTRKYEARLDT